MCTANEAPASPHSPSSVARPAAIALATSRHVSAVTTTRGHGRWSSTGLPATMSVSAAICLTEQSGNMLKPDNQRRRHVDAGDEHQGQMGEHRHIRGLRLADRAARLAEGDAVEAQQQGAESNENAEHQNKRQ